MLYYWRETSLLNTQCILSFQVSDEQMQLFCAKVLYSYTQSRTTFFAPHKEVCLYYLETSCEQYVFLHCTGTRFVNDIDFIVFLFSTL